MIEKKLIALRKAGWRIQLHSHEQYNWTVTLIPNHLNFSTAPYGAGETPDKALFAAIMDAMNRKIACN
jgi:hypothetical protein